MTRVHRLLGLTLLAAAVLVGAAFAVAGLWGGGDDAPDRPWAEGSVHGPWRSVFDGHGDNVGSDTALTLSPMPSRVPEETHAGLIVSTAVYTDVDFRSRMRTVAQLRVPRPNPWEVPWLVWAYTDPEHFYYITLKPNGWELGKRDPAYPGASASWRREAESTRSARGPTSGSPSGGPGWRSASTGGAWSPSRTANARC
ncbi:hypothetical protein ACQEVX_09325 [Streptomyces syringium]|uniref:hypothetical protein n=1 Tax=Streptomyces syringium TaxID=76729 RepID=UPI003D8AE4A6